MGQRWSKRESGPGVVMAAARVIDEGREFLLRRPLTPTAIGCFFALHPLSWVLVESSFRSRTRAHSLGPAACSLSPP